ncbi:hypothetical protein QR680_017777 [Steinernema hermaphroditum]|uniref:Uncharacterized protein n=1 Tax=Steinernema hermaphroditum TaxID=289476 RepID=A0AA39HFS4_9BILA|nr:hypothetical protein QR680_017777 [Steinernema hermaphroditum]
MSIGFCIMVIVERLRGGVRLGSHLERDSSKELDLETRESGIRGFRGLFVGRVPGKEDLNEGLGGRNREMTAEGDCLRSRDANGVTWVRAQKSLRLSVN